MFHLYAEIFFTHSHKYFKYILWEIEIKIEFYIHYLQEVHFHRKA